MCGWQAWPTLRRRTRRTATAGPNAGRRLRARQGPGELFVRARRNLGLAADDPTTDETIYQFGERRLGKAFADVMLDPMVKGVFGGEAHKLSLAASFP